VRKDAKIELMREVPLFAGCTKRELGAIAALADLVDVPEGSRLISEGGRASQFVVLVDGAADVKRNGRRIARLGAGDFCGEIALISDGPPTATVTTTSPSSILVLTQSGFSSLMERMPSIQLRVLRALAERLRPMVV
jgi:CRP-like cAMP-binding protein